MRDADALEQWLGEYLASGVVFHAEARVLRRSYGAIDDTSIYVKVGFSGWDLLLQPDPARTYEWQTITETSDVDVTLSTPDLAALMQTMRTIHAMCSELEEVSRAAALRAIVD